MYPDTADASKEVVVSSGDSNSVGDYERGIETMKRLWGEELAAKIRGIWMKASPDAERYITAVSLGEVWTRPPLDLRTRSLITLAASVGP